MKCSTLSAALFAMLFAIAAQARLNDQQAIKCIEKDPSVASSFHDLETAYEMKMIDSKEFLKVLKRPISCPELKASVKQLHGIMMAKIPDPQHLPESFDSGLDGDGNAVTGDFNPDAVTFPPPPEFHDEFDRPAY